MPFRDDDSDDLDPWEDPERDRDDDDNTVPCPHCGRAVYEGVARCPYCETYLSEEDAPPARKAWWVIAGSLAVMAVVGLWIWKG